jgi:GT2 family glycosyltransferase
MHNSQATIVRCISSILSQKNIGRARIIVVDDKSTDNSVGLVKNLMKTHSKADIVLMQFGRTLTRGEARNKGLELVDTPFVAFVDSDIELPDNWASTLLRFVKDNSKNVASADVYPEGYLAHIAQLFNVRYKPLKQDDLIPAHNFICHTSMIRELGGFDPLFVRGEDAELSLRALKKGVRPIRIKEIICHHNEGTTLRKVCGKVFFCGKAGCMLLFKHRSLSVLRMYLGVLGVLASVLLLPPFYVLLTLLGLPMTIFLTLTILSLMGSSLFFCIKRFELKNVRTAFALMLFYSFLAILFSLGFLSQIPGGLKVSLDSDKQRISANSLSVPHYT